LSALQLSRSVPEFGDENHDKEIFLTKKTEQIRATKQNTGFLNFEPICESLRHIQSQAFSKPRR